MHRVALLCLALAACYEPDAVDCTVECMAPGDCAQGQICGPDHFCAAPDRAGQCTTSDDPQSVSLAVTIAGRGKVSIEKVGACDSDSPAMGNCTFAVPPGVTQQLKAVEGNEREFVSWTQTCSGASSTCTVTPVMALTQVGAKFE
jgi:hypothetical protein